MDRGIWLNEARNTPALPDHTWMVLNLPALDGEAWIAMLAAGDSAGGRPSGNGDFQTGGVTLPGNVTLRSPVVTLGSPRRGVAVRGGGRGVR